MNSSSGHTTGLCCSLAYFMACLRKVLKIPYQDKVPNTPALKKANMFHNPILICKAQIRWAGHVSSHTGLPYTLVALQNRPWQAIC